MTSNYSCLPEDDDFFQSLQRTLTIKYSNYSLTNFISDLLESINNLDDNSQEGFLFCDNDEHTDVYEYFQDSPSIQTDDENDKLHDNQKSATTFQNEDEDNVSVDMFAEFENDLETFHGDSNHTDQMSTNSHPDVEIRQNEAAEIVSVRLCDTSSDDTLYENVETVMELSQFQSISNVDHAKDQILIRQSSKLEEPLIVEHSDNQEPKQNMVQCLPSCSSSISDTSTYCEQYENWRHFNPEFTLSRWCQDINRTSSITTDLSFHGFSPVTKNPPMRRSSSSSTSFHGFSPVSTIKNATMLRGSEIAARETVKNSADCNFDLEAAYTQCFLDSQSENSNVDRRQKFIVEIEKIIMRLNNDLICGRKLSLTVPCRLSWDNCVLDNERLLLRPLRNSKTRRIASKRRMSMILYVVSFVYKLLLNNAKCTKREIYYSDPEYTQNQESVNDAVKDVCLILNVRPWEIGILSSSKGLIAGSIRLTLNDDTILDVGNIDGGILLPHHTTTVKKVETSAKFVLLVEKHTIYQKLLTENICSLLGPCVLVTGKGYPDTNTKVILKKIWDDCKCPIYALVDADPYGIEIMLTYRHGSLNMSFANGDLAIPSIRWIGVYPSEIEKLCLPGLPLTEQDLCRIECMIKRPYISKKVLKELLILKTTLHKTEVEGLTSAGIIDWINSYLRKKIETGMLI